MRTTTILATTLAFALAGCALDGEDEITDADLEGLEQGDFAIVNGTPAPNDTSVVLVFHQTSSTGTGALCTGTLISSRIVITAAHCVPSSYLARVVSLGYDGTKGPFINIIDSRIHPNYDGAGKGNDLALLELAQPAGVPAKSLNTNPLAFSAGAGVRLLGYGDRDPGAANVYGLRYQGTGTVVLRQSNNNVVIGKAPSVVLPGDSGGPTFAKIGGFEMLAGVHSVVYMDSAGQPLYSGDTAVEYHLGWILSTKTLLEVF